MFEIPSLFSVVAAGGVGALLFAYVKPKAGAFISKYTQKLIEGQLWPIKDPVYKRLVRELVVAAEAKFPDRGTGVKKLDYVLAFLGPLGHSKQVRDMIEEAVYALDDGMDAALDNKK